MVPTPRIRTKIIRFSTYRKRGESINQLINIKIQKIRKVGNALYDHVTVSWLSIDNNLFLAFVSIIVLLIGIIGSMAIFTSSYRKNKKQAYFLLVPYLFGFIVLKPNLYRISPFISYVAILVLFIVTGYAIVRTKIDRKEEASE